MRRIVVHILLIGFLFHTLSCEISFQSNEVSIKQQLHDFIHSNVELNETEWYPLPEGDGPIQAKRYIQFIVTKVLPCLMNYTIEVVNWNATEGYYLRSQPKISTAWREPLYRTYQMYVNPMVFNTSFGPDDPFAMGAIITHELNHILDYTKMSTVELSEFGLKYAENYSFLIWYEHETDHRVLQLNFGEGLKAYRWWVYSTLTPPELQAKRTEYYTPLQIDEYIAESNNTYVNPCIDYSLFSYVCNVCHYPPPPTSSLFQ